MKHGHRNVPSVVGAIVETTILRDTWRSLSVDQKVQALFDDGVITKEEYEAKRKSYINS